MIIAQISDTHILAAASDDAEGAARAENLARCVADIGLRGVDAVIHTGDSVHHGQAEEYHHLREILDELTVPVFLVPGNRDRHDVLRAAFGHHAYLPRQGARLHYAVEDFPVRLVGLDSVDAGERKGVFGAARLEWLDETLSREPDRPTILFMHHPPFDIHPHYMDGYRRPGEARDLAALVSRHPQVRRLLCGHVHCPHREAWGGTDATTMPSVAVDLRKGVEGPAKSAPLYYLHDVAADGGVESRMQVVTS